MKHLFPEVNVFKSKVNYHSDPLSLYQQLCQNAPHTLLLESAEITTKDHLQSIIMLQGALMIRCDGYQLTFTALTKNGESLLPAIQRFFNPANGFENAQAKYQEKIVIIKLQPSTDILDEDARLKSCSPLDGLRMLVNHLKPANTPSFEDLFLGGVLAYDLIDTVEPLSKVPNVNNHCPDYLFYLAENLIIIDHQQQIADIVSHTFSTDNKIIQSVEKQTDKFKSLANIPCPIATLIPLSDQDRVKEAVNISDDKFKKIVSELKQEIIVGNIFQVVPSRSFSLPCPNTLGAYRALKKTNPSPYMFYFRGPDFTLFGASPESSLKYEASSRQVEVYPIAGTRPRGKKPNGEIDTDLDSRIELALRLDKKELSEHLMLVDLARNDIARIAVSGTRNVTELLKVDRYSHVMHLVSRVTGALKPELDALHAYQACMNMGTLVGAPKIRAAQLVRQVEQGRRGSYGGAVGYLNALGDMDSCIVIRSAFVTDDIAYIQAGAGVVFDSDPQSEADETRQKAQAVINAIKIGGGSQA